MSDVTHASDSAPVSRWTIFVLLILASVMMLYVLYQGYVRLVTQFGSEPSTGLSAASLAAAVIAILLAKTIGDNRGRAWRRAEESGEKPSRAWLTLTPILLVMSALGVINLAFYSFEGRQILQETMDSAQGNLSNLAGAAHALLRDPEQEKRAGEVTALLASLKREIINPNGSNHCGVGPAARITIAKIHDFLPTFTELSGSDAVTACTQTGALEGIYQAYDDQAQSELKNDTGFALRNGPKRLEYLAAMDTAVAAAKTDIGKAAGGLDQSSLSDRDQSYMAARNALEEGATVYRNQRLQLEDLIKPQQSGLPPAIDVSPARNLGSISSLLGMLLHRPRWSTLVYVAVAVAIDFFMIHLFTLGELAFGKPLDRGRNRKRRARVSTGSGPEFLWVNQE